MNDMDDGIVNNGAQQTNELRGNNKKKLEENDFSSNSVPRPGIEPGWVAPLVFETSASTDSAIWA